MTGFAQDMVRLAGQIRESSRERVRCAPLRAQEMRSFLRKTRTERQLRERQEHQRLKDFTHARLVESNALKDSLVQFVKANRSAVSGLRAQAQGSLDRLRTEFREGARAFWAGLGHASRTPAMAFPAGAKTASRATPLEDAGLPKRAEVRKALGKRGMGSEDVRD